MRGVAWRWIGFHAAAFATASLIQTLALLQDRRSGLKILGESYEWLFVGTLGGAVSLAQGLALKTTEGPLRTLLGLWVGGVAGLSAARGINQVFFPLMTDLVEYAHLSTAVAIATAVSEAAILAFAQGRGKAWAAVVGGSWALARAMPAILIWAQGYPLRGRASWGDERGVEALIHAGCGALFAALTLPALRKTLAQNMAPAA